MKSEYTTLHCKNCGGTDLKEIAPGRLQCAYCGTVQKKKDAQKTKAPSNIAISRKLIPVIAAVVVVAAASIIVFSLLRQQPGEKGTATVPGDSTTSKSYQSDNVELAPRPEGEFSNISAVPDSIGNIYFMGIYKNTGKIALRKPEVSIVLFDENDRKIAAGRGFGQHNFLLPRERTPVKILIQKAPEYTRYEVVHEPDTPFSTKQSHGKIGVQNGKLTQDRYNYIITADVYNRDTVPLQYVNVRAVLFDDEGMITGMGDAYVSEKKLQPGDYSPIRIQIHTVKNPPRSFELFTSSLPLYDRE